MATVRRALKIPGSAQTPPGTAGRNETNQQVAPAPNSNSSSYVFCLGTSPTVAAVVSEVKLTEGRPKTCLPKTQGEALPQSWMEPAKGFFSCLLVPTVSDSGEVVCIPESIRPADSRLGQGASMGCHRRIGRT
jgi:hypothetical protein